MQKKVEFPYIKKYIYRTKNSTKCSLHYILLTQMFTYFVRQDVSDKSVNAHKMPLQTIRYEEFCVRNASNISYVRFTHKKYTVEQVLSATTYVIKNSASCGACLQ